MRSMLMVLPLVDVEGFSIVYIGGGLLALIIIIVILVLIFR
jgi:hypothetical protein